MAGVNHPCCPYRAGSTISVVIDENFSPDFSQRLPTLHLDILKVFEPITIAPVALVRVKGTSQQLIAKFYDRRFNPGFRAPHYNPMEPWDGYREKSFREFVYSGEASKFIREMYQDDFVNSFQWTPAQDEALSHSVSQDSYRNEIATYRRLEWMQGQNIPKLLATFKFEMSDFRPTTYSEFFVVQGFMIEYIPGFLLSDLLEHVDCAKWQTIVDEVVSAIEAAGDFGVLNEDLDHRHFIVRKEQRPGTKEDEDARFVPVMFDFGQTHLCEEYGSLEEWLEAKCLQGEEDYVAVSMRDMVRKSGGTLQVTRRHRWGWHNEVGWHCPQGLFPWRQSPAVPVREVHMEKRSPLDFMYCLEIVG